MEIQTIHSHTFKSSGFTICSSRFYSFHEGMEHVAGLFGTVSVPGNFSRLEEHIDYGGCAASTLTLKTNDLLLKGD